jgi:hypothetical protein
MLNELFRSVNEETGEWEGETKRPGNAMVSPAAKSRDERFCGATEAPFT